MLSADASVGRHQDGGPGAISRARLLARKGLEEAVRLAEEHAGELARIAADPDLKDAAKDRRAARVRERHRDELAVASDEAFRRAFAQLAEREVALQKVLSPDEPPRVGDADRLLRRLDLANLLTLFRPQSDQEVTGLVIGIVRQGAAVAGELVRTAALALRDPLQAQVLAGLLEADAKPRAARALGADGKRLRAALETRLLRRMRDKLGLVRHLLVEDGQPANARQTLEEELK